MYKLDLHCHYKRRAISKVTHEHIMIEAAINAGLHGIAFTEHGQELDQSRITELRHMYPDFGIYSGVEIATTDRAHVLVFGVDMEILGMKFCYEDLWEIVTRCSGAMILAHPLRHGRPLPLGFRDCPPHAIEAASRNTPKDPDTVEFIVATAEMAGIPQLRNSDAHKPRHVGPWYSECSHLPGSTMDLVESLREHEIHWRLRG